MKPHSVIFFLACLCITLSLSAPPACASSSGCLVCHNVMSGKATLSSGAQIDLRIDAEAFQKSVHGFIECTGCHKSFDDNPHVKPGATVPADTARLAEKIGSKAVVDPVAYSACKDCHTEIYDQVLSSVHGTNIVEKKMPDGALCLDCHGSPHIVVRKDDPSSPVNQFKVVETCGECHGNEELSKKYGNESDIIGTYMESFHGRKHHLGHKGAPTCISCHGYHDVKSDTDPSSPVFGNNRIQTCGKCHKGANEKFISGISHKPAGPIPHYAEKILILLTLSTFAFIVSHVFLDLYSQIRDAIFRRRRTGKDEQ
ncbi:MAG: cytochrome c3 family protein [Thermodesulfovibrionales bacterium]